MKRVIVGAFTLVMLLPAVALAQDGSELGSPEGPAVGGTGGSIGDVAGAGGSAFTGAEIVGLVAVGLLLVALGIAALMFARRRRAAQLPT